mgnify:CR=1 FL=1
MNKDDDHGVGILSSPYAARRSPFRRSRRLLSFKQFLSSRQVPQRHAFNEGPAMCLEATTRYSAPWIHHTSL